MSQEQLTRLESRVRSIIDRVGFLPSRDYFLRNEHLAELLEEVESFEEFDSFTKRFDLSDILNTTTVPIPSLRQKLAASQIAHDGFYHNRKKIEISIPGARKTGGVLAAIDLINTTYMPELGGGKAKMLYVTPSSIVGTMMDEARRFLPDYNLVCITQKDRIADIERAAHPDTDIVFLAYEMSFRKAGISAVDLDEPDSVSKLGLDDKETAFTRYLQVMAEIPTDSAVNHKLDGMLATNMITESERNWIHKHKSDKSKLVRWIIDKEQRYESATIVESLRSRVFGEDNNYYVALGEAHNLVSFDSKTAQAFKDIFRDARWGVLETGTAVRNTPKQMDFLAYLLEFVDEPGDFHRVVANNPKKVKAALHLHVIKPAITSLEQIDPDVPPRVENDPVYYDVSQPVFETHVALMNSELFTKREKFILYTALLAAPNLLFRVDPDSDRQFHKKIRRFFGENPDLIEKLETSENNRIDTAKELIDKAISEGKKTALVCDNFITDYVASHFKDYGVRIIDQTVAVRPDTNGISDRSIAVVEAATNPDVDVVVTTYGTLKEGIDFREITNFVMYQGTSLASRHVQTVARSHRSGQREIINVDRIHARGIELDDELNDFRIWKQNLSDRVFEDGDLTLKDLEDYFRDINIEDSRQLGPMLSMNSSGKLAMMFAGLFDKGSDGFSSSMNTGQNANLLATHYNHQWDFTYSANVARLMEQVIHKLEDRAVPIETILDGASGPATLGRTLGVPTTNVDLLKLQLEYGVDALEDTSGSRFYMGSVHDLSKLVNLENSDSEVFDSSNAKEGIESNSQDLYACSLAIYYLSPLERKLFMEEANRVVKDDGYLLITIPRTKIAEDAEGGFLNDIEKMGFTVDRELSGIYSANTARNVDSGEEGSGKKFATYVIVAQKTGVPSEEDAEFQLRSDYKVINESRDSIIKKGKKESKRPRMVFDEFYRLRAPKAFVEYAGFVDDFGDNKDLIDALKRVENMFGDL